MTEALYRLLSTETLENGVVAEIFASDISVLSGWGHIQHGGPVNAILTRSMENCQPRANTRLTRITIDILGPVPIADIRVHSRIARPGRRIELVESVLEARDANGQWLAAAKGSAWRLVTRATEDVVHRADRTLRLPAEHEAPMNKFKIASGESIPGFVHTFDWRILDHPTTEGERSVAWGNFRSAVVEGETPSEIQRVAAIADTANGVGARLNIAKHSFMNTESTIHLFQQPRGPWYGLEAETSVGADGVGMSSAVIHDQWGPIGKVTQNLLIERLSDRS